MSLFSTDFSEYTTGVAPSDWTNRWGTNWTTNVISNATDSYGDKLLELNGSVNQYQLMTWDDVDGADGRENVELLSRFRLVSGAGLWYHSFMFVRASGATQAVSDNYYIRWFGSTLQLARTVSGTQTVLDSIAYSTRINMATRWVWVRFRVIGSNLKVKFWDVRYPEPDRWSMEVTDTNVTTAGWVGVGGHNAATTTEIDYFSVGTDWDYAPYPVSDASAEVRDYRQYVEIAAIGAAAPSPSGGMPLICINT